MLQFETLLLRQLQKQQNRDEFCDTVLHTQGLAVPVHGCVLSAFSPGFYGTLSSMAPCRPGQRRLIELQAVDGRTLLGLVSLLYSGQLQENGEQVLSAARTLGFELPQWEEEVEEERNASKKAGRKKASEDVERGEAADATGTTGYKGGRMERAKRTESGTQTERELQTDESGAPPEVSLDAMYLVDPSAYPVGQEPGDCADIRNVALPWQAIHPAPLVASGTGGAHPASESAYLPEIYLYSLETSNRQTPSRVAFPPHDGFLDQTAADALKQFEGNIPGFINYFLDSADSPNEGRTARSRAREGTVGERAVQSARARSTAKESGRDWRRLTAGGGRGTRQRRVERWGSVACLAWRGQGGGRVGRLPESRSARKNRTRAASRRRVGEAFVEAGEARGRGRHGQRGKVTARVADSEKQTKPSRKAGSKSRPRVRPLPPASSGLSTFEQNTVDPTVLDLLHTRTPVPANQAERIQPIDALLEDIMTGLHFLPRAENRSATDGGPPLAKASCSKRPVPKQQTEGEIGDILDHFLRTFDQQVGSDAAGETSQGADRPDSGTDPRAIVSKTFTQPPSRADRSPAARPSVADKNNVREGQKRPSQLKKPSRARNVVRERSGTRMLTRSQAMKRKAKAASTNCPEKESAETKKKRQRDETKQDGNKKPSRVRGKRRENRAGTRTDWCGLQKRSCESKRSGCFRAGRSSVRDQKERTPIERASPDSEKVQMLLRLRNKRNDGRECQYVGIHWGKNEKNGRLVKRQCASEAEERFQVENRLKKNQEKKEKGRIEVEKQESKNSIARRKDGETADERSRGEGTTERSDLPLLPYLPSDTAQGGIQSASASVGAAESATEAFGSRPGEPVSAPGGRSLRSDVVLPSTRSAVLLTAGLCLDAEDPAARLAFTSRPFRKLPGPLSSTGDSEEDDDDDDDDDVDVDVDVVEVSSPTTELPAVSILEVDLSTEDELEEDSEIDVLGPHQP